MFKSVMTASEHLCFMLFDAGPSIPVALLFFKFQTADITRRLLTNFEKFVRRIFYSLSVQTCEMLFEVSCERFHIHFFSWWRPLLTDVFLGSKRCLGIVLRVQCLFQFFYHVLNYEEGFSSFHSIRNLVFVSLQCANILGSTHLPLDWALFPLKETECRIVSCWTRVVFGLARFQSFSWAIL